MGNFDWNAASTFLKGFLQEQDRLKAEKKVNAALKDKNVVVSSTVNPVTGQVQYSIKPKPTMTPYQQAQIGLARQKLGQQQLQPVQKFQNLAAGQGWNLNVASNLPPSKQVETARQLYAAKKSREVRQPSWAQQQEVAALKSGIARGHVVIGRFGGEPEEFDVKNRVDALRAIELAGFNPVDFQDVLAQYPEIKIDDIIKKGGKSYRVVGIDKDGVPLVELIK